jgi:glycerate-2-kinase
MKRLYTAHGRVDAFLLRDRLAHADIDAQVFNQHMQGIVGDVPPDVAGPQVWVDDEAWERARAVLAAFRAERSREGTRACARCGEESPATFDLCWKCGTSLPG